MLTVRVFVAYRAIQDKAFGIAKQILEPAFEQIRKSYGPSSTEFIIVGTQLALSLNALAMERDAEILLTSMVGAAWPERKPDFIGANDVVFVRSLTDMYLFMAYSDSLIGRGLYGLAKELLLELVNCRVTTENCTLLCLLRVLKINRRQRVPDSTFHSWTLLQKAIGLLDHTQGGLLYQCYEEATCILSVVDNLDTAQVSRAKDVIDALDALDINGFDGSAAMKLTLEEYKQELKVYRRDFGLFSVTGPQEHYCRYIRDGFPKAAIAFVERIGAANWERFQRLREMPRMDEAVEPVITVDPSKFHDSGIGSSLQASDLLEVIKAPSSRKSKLSMNTTPSPGLSGLLEIPPEVIAGKPYQCEWCGKNVKIMHPKQQWR
jgi:hypothetical protein